jgi:hypothetical protein
MLTHDTTKCDSKFTNHKGVWYVIVAAAVVVLIKSSPSPATSSAFSMSKTLVGDVDSPLRRPVSG